MGSANSHEIRQIVDEAVVALRSGQQQQQSFCHHRPSEVISLDEDDDGVLSNEDGDYATYSTDDQDPKKWGFKIDNSPGRPMSRDMKARRFCGGAGSCGHLRSSPAGAGRRHTARHRTTRRRCEEALSDADELQPRRGRRRTLLFEEFDASPRGASGKVGPEDGYRYREREGTAGSRGWSRRRRDGSVDSRGVFAMHGALRDDEHQSELRGGGGAEDGGNRGRKRSWERRSGRDKRIGEIDKWSEGSSYTIGEGEERMLVPRREDGGMRVVRFGRG
ncbi:hypothetical protein LZ32DRAFT_687593 [Colletotrichum eremochloae]|nr:hypothetical protein LZ32DRAFT_687593 [Colletotrichum eremochloae]